MPYKSVPLLLTTWTICQVCWVPVAHLDQRRHDEAMHPQQAEDPPAPPPPEVVEEAIVWIEESERHRKHRLERAS